MKQYSYRVAARWWSAIVLDLGDGDTFTRLDIVGAVCTAVGTLAVFIIGSSM